MKKFTAILITILLVVSLCACGDNIVPKETLPHTTNKIHTEAKQETSFVTEAPTEKLTEAPTEAPTAKPTEPKTEATKAPDSFTSDDLVLADVTGHWDHVSTNGHHGISITKQDKNTITMTITAIRGQAAQIATAEVTVNVAVDAAGGQWSENLGGKGTFTYEDSFLNKGRGEILIYGSDSLTLYLYPTSEIKGGWSIAPAAGDYIKK